MKAAENQKKGDPASTEAGVWIDHRRAVIAIIAGEKQDMQQVTSNLEKHTRFSGAAAEQAVEDQRDRRVRGRLNKYYDEVIASIRDANSILILGPGEAKVEFQARLEHEGLGERIVGVETVDKMTDGQIAARARERFRRSKGKPAS